MDYLRTTFEYIIGMFFHYYGDLIWLILAAIAAIFLMIKGDKKHRFVVLSSVVIYLMIFNPVLYKYLYSQIIFWRLFWLVPTFLLIVLGFAQAAKLLRSSWKILLLTAAVTVVIVLSGTNMFTELKRDSYTGIYKLPRGTEEVGSLMLSLDDHPRCVVPMELITSMRQYSGDIEPMYGRNIWGYIRQCTEEDRTMFVQISADNPNYDYIFLNCRDNGYNFVINDADKQADEAVAGSYGYTQVYEAEGYIIYYNPDL